MTTAVTKAFVILDGTLLPIDRIAADRPFYSGKHKKFFEAYTALETPRRPRRWNEHIDIAYQTCRLMQAPNGREGTWIGSWPCSEAEPYPVRGVAVVYVLFDANNQPCYVGSTNQFRIRMGKHVKGAKAFTKWQAYPCPSREHAYELEDRLLKERLPGLNKKASR